jgi:hypothetical protein
MGMSSLQEPLECPALHASREVENRKTYKSRDDIIIRVHRFQIGIMGLKLRKP